MQVVKIEGSSNIFAIGHDGSDLFVEMKGGTYKYFDVPVGMFEDMQLAPSAGKYLNEFIKPHFRYEEASLAFAAPRPVSTPTVSLDESSVIVATGISMIQVELVGKLTHSTDGAAGYDLHSTESLCIYPGQRARVGTGVHLKMPPWMAALVVPRSGLAMKYGITVVNAPGLIDPDYTGEIGVILHNLGNERFDISVGTRIAQLMFTQFCAPELIQVETVETGSKRGAGGFGSTGA